MPFHLSCFELYHISLQVLLSSFLIRFATSGQSYDLAEQGTFHEQESVLLVSQHPDSPIMLRNVDTRTNHIFWSELEVDLASNEQRIEKTLRSYEIIMFETSDPLSIFTATKQTLFGKSAKLMYISQCTHFILSKYASSEINITKCGPNLYTALQLDMIIAPTTEVSNALSRLHMKSMFYPNWSLRKNKQVGVFTQHAPQFYANSFQSRGCKAGGIFVSYGSRGGKRARDMSKIHSILTLTRKHGTNAVLCSHMKPSSNKCELFNICEYCSPNRYIELMKCMRILLLPLSPRGSLDSQVQTESGRGLRTIISALEQKVHIITADTPYMRDYLLNYSCATLLPLHSSAREYFKRIRATLRKVYTGASCEMSYYPHDSSAETALPKLLDIVSAL